jgi:3-(3-hydroxy-phenyl)propionate hydroxylase
MNSTRSTDFITPKSKTSCLSQRGARPGADHAFARRAGELRPPVGAGLPDRFGPEHARQRQLAGDMVPGAPMDDAPMQRAGQDAGCSTSSATGSWLLVFADARVRWMRSTLAQFKRWPAMPSPWSPWS